MPRDISGDLHATEEADSAKATGAILFNLAVQHMMAAARFSRAVAEIEHQHAGQQFGPFWDEVLHLSIASIFASVASLEAYANELFFDRAIAFPGYSAEQLDELWETFGKKNTLEKFAFALLLRNKPELARGARPYQDVSALIELRHALVHFKPEWSNAADRHKSISDLLKSRFTPSPFVSDDLLFPRRWATHGATNWAVERCLAFAEEFERLAGLPAKYNRADSAFDPG